MATEIQIRERLDTMRCLPSKLERLVLSMGTTQWPGQPLRRDLLNPLTDQDRTEITDRLKEVNSIISGGHLTANECAKARLSLLTKMLLGMPAAGSSSEAAAEARAGMYDDAVGDMPPWAINAAIKRWAKGEVPDLKMGAMNFSFAPAPAVLRAICKAEIQPFEIQAGKLQSLLDAVPVERAMDPAPIERKAGDVVTLKLRKM